jgi:muramoyltetrapeptide carboxypeptidase
MSHSSIESTIPPRLRPGDTVAVVAPAGPVPGDRLRRGLEILESRYRVRVAHDVLRTTGYLAGGDDRRAAELAGALADPDVRAVFVARGGYGIFRVLPFLDPAVVRRDPKVIVGFSDATALLAWAARAGVRGVHGPVVAQLGELPASDHAALFDLLERPSPPPPLASERAAGAGSARSIEGRLVGGNLCMVAHLVGTPWAIDTDGALLLLEEVGERPYAIDRYLTRLHLAGALLGVRGLAIGDLVRCEERVMIDSPAADVVVDERARAFGLPALAGLPVGHGARNRAVPIGARAVLDTGRLELLEPAVA